MVKRALREAVREPAEELRTLELERLDSLYATVTAIIETGSPKDVLNAIDRALRIMERRSKLLGLDAPVRQDLRITDRLDAQIEQLAAEILAVRDWSDATPSTDDNGASPAGERLWPRN